MVSARKQKLVQEGRSKYQKACDSLFQAKILEPAVAIQRRWLYLIAGAICFLFIGFVYGWSILAVSLQEELGWTSAQTSMTFTISTAMYCIGGVVGAQLSKRTAPQLTIILSAVLICVGYVIASNVRSDQIIILHLAYGAVVGCSSGMAHNAIMGTVNRWFPDKVGTSSGFLTLGMGISSLAIGWLVGLSLDALGWRVTFDVIGVATALVMLTVSLVIRVPAEGQVLPAPDATFAAEKAEVRLATHPYQRQQDPRTKPSGYDFTTWQVLRMLPFYLTFAVAVLFATIYLGIMGNAKQIALEVGAAATVATLMVGFVSLFDGVSRLGSGFFFDRFGYRVSLVVIALIFLLSTVSLFVAFSLGSLVLVLVGFALLGCGFGSTSTVLAAITNRFYGQRHYGTNLSVAYLDFLPASFIGPTIAGAIETSLGSYHWAFAVFALMGLVALVFSIFIYPPKAPNVD